MCAICWLFFKFILFDFPMCPLFSCEVKYSHVVVFFKNLNLIKEYLCSKRNDVTMRLSSDFTGGHHLFLKPVFLGQKPASPCNFRTYTPSRGGSDCTVTQYSVYISKGSLQQTSDWTFPISLNLLRSSSWFAALQVILLILFWILYCFYISSQYLILSFSRFLTPSKVLVNMPECTSIINLRYQDGSEGSASNPAKYNNQDFTYLKDSHVRRGRLFVDDTFPPDNRSLGDLPGMPGWREDQMEWLRPSVSYTFYFPLPFMWYIHMSIYITITPCSFPLMC